MSKLRVLVDGGELVLVDAEKSSGGEEQAYHATAGTASKVVDAAERGLTNLSRVAEPLGDFVQDLSASLSTKNLDGVESIEVEFGVSGSGGTDIKVVNAKAEGFLTVKLSLSRDSLKSVSETKLN